MKYVIVALTLSLSSILFSQDKLITLSGAEYKGTYLGLKDGKIEFLQTGKNSPVLVPKLSVKQIFLSNGQLIDNNGQLIDGSVDAIGVPNAGTSESNVESVNNLLELRSNEFNNKQSELQKTIFKTQQFSGSLIATAALMGLYNANRECKECNLDEFEDFVDQAKLLDNMQNILLLLAGMSFWLE
jgi:hypothetical protein|tara:strand:+ start:42 stop:596 length:555 start_codon:yes stop_codon:yes gene_type:complete